MADRVAARQALLRAAGWGDATAGFLAGDASDRRYERLTGPGGTAVLMDAPPGKGDDPADFVAVSKHLLGLSLSAPRVIGADLGAGFLLLEDFGDDVYARVLAIRTGEEAALYAVAVEALVVLQGQPVMAGLPDLSAREWAGAAGLVCDQYCAVATGAVPEAASLVECLAGLLDDLADEPKVMILRDFHAENLIWLPGRKGAARAGLLDFQLAQMGHRVYDLVSLLQDARRDVGPETARQMGDLFCARTGMARERFDLAMAVWGAQRALRILGVFARLARVQGKMGYLALMPRVGGHLQGNLRHPALGALRQVCDDVLVAPSPDVQARFAAAAGVPA
ncbi:MAG: aminoglycoside phosphotransferase family protein [Paracoccaceae bacterium]